MKRWFLWLGLTSSFLLTVWSTTGCGGNQCRTDRDCVSLVGSGSTCNNGNCVKSEAKTSDAAAEVDPNCRCQVNADCSLCGGGRTRCEKGICVAAVTSTVKTWEKCNNDKGIGCPDKNRCIGFDSGSTHGYCLPECGAAGLTCPSKSKCVKLSSGKGVCLPIGPIQEGKACVFAQSGDKLDSQKLCASGMDCYEGTCQKPVKVGPFAKCDPIRQCTAPQTCTIMRSGSSHGYCINTCKEGETTCDNGTGRCVNPRVDVFLCVPNPQGQVGNSCSVTLDDPKLDPKRICVTGLRCINGTCQKPKESDVDGECSQNAVCKAGTRCINAPKASKGICAPQVASCQQPNVCQTGRTCIQMDANSAVCARVCNAKGDCPLNLRCVPLQAGPQSISLCLP